MNFKILKKDLKRKKSMNLILLIFIFLAMTFIAGSLNNLAVVTNGMEGEIMASIIKKDGETILAICITLQMA